MPTTLIALGSNLGDSAAIFGMALSELNALPNLRVERHSHFRRYPPIGGAPGQSEYLNAAVVVQTMIAPLVLLDQLQRIESRHGRTRTEPWAARTLDLDLLLYGSEIVDTATLSVPHMRMAYRRFVLEPAVEVAPTMIHPIIGWPLERLILHLNAARDQIALLSPSASLRDTACRHLSARFGMTPIPPPRFATANQHWPPDYASWLAVPATGGAEAETALPSTPPLRYAAADFPKLSVLLDGEEDVPQSLRAEWSRIVRQPGRGPVLRLRAAPQSQIEAELNAAVESVWPDLGSDQASCVE